MTVEEAVQAVEDFLTEQCRKSGDNENRAVLEWWSKPWDGVVAFPNRHEQVGFRVAEVGFVHGEPGKPGSGGSSFMQVDVPDGAAACLIAERVVIALLEKWEDEEITSEKERLVAACWGWESPELKRFVAEEVIQ